MILPIGTLTPDTAYQFASTYRAYNASGGSVPATPYAPATSPVRADIRDTVTLSLAARKIIDQAVRLSKMNLGKG